VVVVLAEGLTHERLCLETIMDTKKNDKTQVESCRRPFGLDFVEAPGPVRIHTGAKAGVAPGLLPRYHTNYMSIAPRFDEG
jgi:hypothetical protein